MPFFGTITERDFRKKIPKFGNIYSQKIVVRPFYLAKMKNYESIYPSRGLGGASWGEITFSPQSPTHTDSKEK